MTINWFLHRGEVIHAYCCFVAWQLFNVRRTHEVSWQLVIEHWSMGTSTYASCTKYYKNDIISAQFLVPHMAVQLQIFVDLCWHFLLQLSSMLLCGLRTEDNVSVFTVVLRWHTCSSKIWPRWRIRLRVALVSWWRPTVCTSLVCSPTVISGGITYINTHTVNICFPWLVYTVLSYCKYWLYLPLGWYILILKN